MARGPQTFRKRDVVRAIEAAKAAGMEVLGYEIEPDGKIVVFTGDAVESAPADTSANPWDEVSK